MSSPSAGSSSPATHKIVLAKIEALPDGQGGIIASTEEHMEGHVLGYLEVQQEVTEGGTIYFQPNEIEIDGEHLLLTQGEEGGEIIVVVSTDQETGLTTMSKCDPNTEIIYAEADHTMMEVDEVSEKCEIQCVLGETKTDTIETSQKDVDCIQGDDKHLTEVQVTYSTDDSSVVEVVENSASEVQMTYSTDVVELVENSASKLQIQDITEDASRSGTFVEVVADSEEGTIEQFATQVIDEDGNVCYVVEGNAKENDSLVSIPSDESPSHILIDNSDSAKGDDESEIHLVTEDDAEYTVVNQVEGGDVIETETTFQASEIGASKIETPDVYHVSIEDNAMENETTIEVVEEDIAKNSKIGDVQEDNILNEGSEVTVATKDSSIDVLDDKDEVERGVSDITENIALQDDAQNDGAEVGVTVTENDTLIEVVEDGGVADSCAVNEVSENIALHDDTKSEEVVSVETETLIEVADDDDVVEVYNAHSETDMRDSRGKTAFVEVVDVNSVSESNDVRDVSKNIATEKGNPIEDIAIATDNSVLGNDAVNLNVEGEPLNVVLSEDAEVSNSANRVAETVEVESRTFNHVSQENAIESNCKSHFTEEMTSSEIVGKGKNQATVNFGERNNHSDEEIGKVVADNAKDKIAIYDFTVEFCEENESESKATKYKSKCLPSNSDRVTDDQVKVIIDDAEENRVGVDYSDESASPTAKDVERKLNEEWLNEPERTDSQDATVVDLKEKESVSDDVTDANEAGVVRVSTSGDPKLLNISVCGNGAMFHDDVKTGGDSSGKSESAVMLANDTCMTTENAECNESVVGNVTITSELKNVRTDELVNKKDSASTQKVVHSKKRVPSRRKISADVDRSKEKSNRPTSDNSRVMSSKTKDSPCPASDTSPSNSSELDNIQSKVCTVVLKPISSPTRILDATSTHRRKSSRQQARRESSVETPSESLTPKLQKSLKKILSTPEKKSESGSDLEVNLTAMVSKIGSKLQSKEEGDGDKTLKRKDSSSKIVDEPSKAKANGIHGGIAKESVAMTLNKIDNPKSKEKSKTDKQQQNITKRKLFTKDSPSKRKSFTKDSSKRARQSPSKKVTFSSGSDSQSQDERFDALLQCQNKMTKSFSSPRKSLVVVPLMSSLSFSPTKKRKTGSTSEESSPKKLKLKSPAKTPKKETKPSISNLSTPVKMKDSEIPVAESLGTKKEKCMFYIRYQSPTKTPEKEKNSPSLFNCKECHFKTSRIDNIIQHYKECSLVLQQDIFKWDLGQGMGEKTPTRFTLEKETVPPTVQSKSIPKKKVSQKKDSLKKTVERKKSQSTTHSGEGDVALSETKDNLSNISDEFETDSDNDELPPAFGTPSKSDLPYKEDDIVWVDWRNQHWPALVRRIYAKTKKVSVLFIDTPMPTKGVRVTMGKISTFDNATRNKQYTSEGRTTTLGDKQIKAVQKAEDYLRKLCLGLKLSALEFFNKADGGYIPDFENSNETALDADSSLFDHPLFNAPSSPADNGRNPAEDTDEDKLSPMAADREEQMQKMKERRKKQNLSFLKCIKDGKVEAHLMGVYQGTITNDRHKKFHSEVASERNQLKHVTWFGPIDDEEQQEEIIDYCLNLFKTNFVKKETFDLMAYVFEVWTPEAIVKAISRVLLINLPEAEDIFEKGIEWIPEHPELLLIPSEKRLLEPLPP